MATPATTYTLDTTPGASTGAVYLLTADGSYIRTTDGSLIKLAVGSGAHTKDITQNTSHTGDSTPATTHTAD
jgi:hypothetical protein